ncbi:hypothetical protein FRC08_006274 [Ceratobasidium sp. 394]|nr:hypothetical protein FRC08_006274 [Ceratobasidium sp. 394]
MFDGLTWPKIKSPAPPSCYEALTDALSPLEAQNIKAALRTAVTDTLATGDVSSLVEEIKRLGQGALDTERSFYEISSGLKKVDGARSVVPKLQPEWEELRGRYREILQGSRETATKIESHFNHLDGVVFCMISDAINNPRDNGKLDLAIKELAGFNEKPDLSQYTGGQALSTYSQEFTDLRRDVESFLDKLKEIPMKRSFSKHLSDVKDKIVGLGRGIVRCGFVVSAITTAMNIFAIVAGLLDGQDFANITLVCHS